MENSPFVRDADKGDLDDLVQIKPGVALHLDRLRDAHGDGFRYLVLEAGGEVAGFACLVFVRPAYWSDAGDTSHLPQIVDLRVLPSRRGKGFGTILIQALETFAAARGCTELFLDVDPLNNPRAHALYLHLGYRALQDEPYLKHWDFVDSGGTQHAGNDWIVDMVKTVG